MASVMICLAFLGCAEGGGDQEAVAVWRAAIERWEAEVSFKCKYEHKSGLASTVERALGAVSDQHGSEFAASGVLIKLGRTVRASFVPAKKPVQINATKTGTGSLYKYISREQITNHSFNIRHDPRQLDLVEVAAVSLAKVEANRLNLGQVPLDVSPLHPLEGDKDDILSLWSHVSPQRDPAASVMTVDDENVEIVLSGPGQRRTVVLWTQPALPVVKSIRHQFKNFGGLSGEWIARADGFVLCGDHYVPSRIVNAMRVEGEKYVSWKQWRALDLGANAPSQQDFVLELGRDALVMGLKDFTPKGANREIDISKLTDADIIEPVPLATVRPLRQQHPQPERRRPVLLIAGWVVLFGAVAVLIVWLRHRRLALPS